jgi:transposase InsO family protein
VNGLCRAAGVSRAGYYRFRLRAQPQESDMNLRSQIQQIALRWPAYGYRRVHAELLRQGWSVNHKRILRPLRADNLLCLRRRKFLLTTMLPYNDSSANGNNPLNFVSQPEGALHFALRIHYPCLRLTG